MISTEQVKPVMNRGEVAIGFEKRWIARHRLVQEIDCLQLVRRRRGKPQNIVGARIELESDEIGGWLVLNSESLSRCDFGVQSFGDFLRDLALDCEEIIQIA